MTAMTGRARMAGLAGLAGPARAGIGAGVGSRGLVAGGRWHPFDPSLRQHLSIPLGRR